jgi:hypothetical protein
MFHPPQIKQLPYTWSTPRGGRKIEAIIAHGTVGTDSRAYLSRGGDLPDGSDKRVSIHVLIPKAGDPIYRYVPDAVGANHAGFGHMPARFTQVNPNLITLGFELENLQDGKDPYPDSQLLAMGWQINAWRKAYGYLPVLRHTDIDPPPRKYDTVGLSVAQIEQWCVKAAALLIDPLHATTIAGVDGREFRCSAAAKTFYDANKGAALLGLAREDERAVVGRDGRACSVLPCERAIIKVAPEGPHLALLDEAVDKEWIR